MVRGGLLKVLSSYNKSPTAYNVYGIPQRTSIGCSTYFFSGPRPAPRTSTGPAAPPVGVAVLVDPTGRYLARACVLPASQRSVPTQCRSCSSLARSHEHRNSSFLSRNPRLWTARTADPRGQRTAAALWTRRLMLAVRLLARVCLISAASSSSTHRPLLQLRRMRTPQQSLVSRTPATEVLVSRTVTGVDPECVQRVLNATKTKLPSWEQCRSGDDCELPLDPPRTPPILPYRALHRAEYGLLRGIQRTPGLLSPSLAVHYSLLPKVITPLLAIIVWFSSLPLGASLITFVCAADLVNTALKWAVQRPRPRWYSPSHESGLEVKAGNIAWEVDLSFPSAHTQFFAGLAFCAAALNGWSAVLPAAFGAFIGLTRNYLSMHWPSDTIAALGVGAVLGTLWGRVDPWRRLLEAGSPLLSLTAATAFTSGLLCLMVAVRQAVPPVQADIKTYWYANALAALPERARAETRSSAQRQLKPRSHSGGFGR